MLFPIISGEWTVTLLINNRLVDNCKVDVCDPSQVRVSGLRAGMPGTQHKFHSKSIVAYCNEDMTKCKHYFISHIRIEVFT